MKITNNRALGTKMTREEMIVEEKKLSGDQKEAFDFWMDQGVTFERALKAAKSC